MNPGAAMKTRSKSTKALELLRTGQTTLAELKGIGSVELQAGVRAGRRLMEDGAHLSAAEILSCLALYDPYRPDVWLALEELFRRERQPELANLFARLAKAMAA